MSDRIIVDQAFNTSKMLAQFVQKALIARDAGNRVLTLLNHAQAGNPATWSAVAAELGLTDKGAYTKEAQAQDAWTIASNAMAKLNDASVIELSRLDQG